MSKEIYRYNFNSIVPLEDIEASLLLAILATESLHGEAQVRLDVAHFFEADQRCCVIDASTPVGRDLNRLFAGFVNREFGADVFEVEHVNELHPQNQQEVQT